MAGPALGVSLSLCSHKLKVLRFSCWIYCQYTAVWETVMVMWNKSGQSTGSDLPDEITVEVCPLYTGDSSTPPLLLTSNPAAVIYELKQSKGRTQISLCWLLYWNMSFIVLLFRIRHTPPGKKISATNSVQGKLLVIMKLNQVVACIIVNKCWEEMAFRI